MAESLRDQQKLLARTRILEAAAQEIVSGGLAGLSMPVIAERSGASLRTVYNYFKTKDTLVEAIAVEAERRFQELGVVPVVEDFDELANDIRHTWRLFGELGTLGEAYAIVKANQAVASGRSSLMAENLEVTDGIRNGVAELCPDLEETKIHAIASAIRVLVSFDAFQRLTHEFGLDPTVSSEVTAWVFAVLRDALSSGQDPFAD